MALTLSAPRLSKEGNFQAWWGWTDTCPGHPPPPPPQTRTVPPLSVPQALCKPPHLLLNTDNALQMMDKSTPPPRGNTTPWVSLGVGCEGELQGRWVPFTLSHHCSAGPDSVLCLSLLSSQGPERCTTVAMRHPGWPLASASGPPSSLASSSTFDKGAEGPGRPRRTSPRRGLGRRAARGLLSMGRAMHRRTGGGAERPRMAPSPTCRDRSRRRLRCTDPTTCHQTVTRHHRPGDVARHRRCPPWLPRRWGRGAVGAGAAQSLHRDVRLVVSLSRLRPKRPQG